MKLLIAVGLIIFAGYGLVFIFAQHIKKVKRELKLREKRNH